MIDDTLGRVAAASRDQDVIDLMSRTAARRGYHVVAIGSSPKGADFNGYFHSTWPQEWIDLYIREGMVVDDPMTAAASINQMPFLWSDMIAGRKGIQLTPAQHRVAQRGAEHGYLEGLCVPIHGPGTYVALASYGGRDPDTSLAAIAELHMLALHAHVRLTALVQRRPENVPQQNGAGLSQREREALACLLAGLTDAGIAQKLGVTERTARFHIDNARRKLGVKTRGQALATAIAMGLLAG